MTLAEFINLVSMHRDILKELKEQKCSQDKFEELAEQLEETEKLIAKWLPPFVNGLFCANCKHHRYCPSTGNLCGITYSFVYPQSTLCGKFEPKETN